MQEKLGLQYDPGEYASHFSEDELQFYANHFKDLKKLCLAAALAQHGLGPQPNNSATDFH